MRLTKQIIVAPLSMTGEEEEVLLRTILQKRIISMHTSCDCTIVLFITEVYCFNRQKGGGREGAPAQQCSMYSTPLPSPLHVHPDKTEQCASLPP